MKCFNHPEMEAVATCQKCGKGLCRECAGKYTPCLCESCANQIQRDKQEQVKKKEEQQKQKYEDALVDTSSEFIKTTIIGIIIGVLFTWVATKDSDAYSTIDYVETFFVAFCVPFGWKFLTYLQSFFPIFLLGTFWFWIIYIVIKFILSVFLGIPAFIYQVVKTIMKTISTKSKIKNMK